MLGCTPDALAEMVTAGGESCAWHISAVLRVFSLSREGEDYKVCRFSNTCCAEMRLVLQGHANGGEIPRVLLCKWQQCQVPASGGPENHEPGYTWQCGSQTSNTPVLQDLEKALGHLERVFCLVHMGLSSKAFMKPNFTLQQRD